MTSSSTEIERLAGRALEAALAVAAGVDGIAFARQPIGQRQDEAGLVFDEQQALHDERAGCDAARSRRRSDWTMARSAACARRPPAGHVNSLPSPRRALTVTRPPCASTMRWTRLRPRPAPWICAGDDVGGAVERLEDARVIGGVDADAAIGDGDAHVASPCRALTPNPIRPPAPYLIALPIRF